jgi:lipid-A-disaccharide synthase-like uncharacterized protein
MSQHPFTNRERRLRRREERNLFRRKLLPLTWFISALGSVGVLVLVGYYLIHGEWLYQFAGLFIALAVLPLIMTAVGWLRGHHNDRLEEP